MRLLRIYGDSLSLPRAMDGVAPDQVYAEALSAILNQAEPTFLYNRSIGGATIRELYNAYRKDNGYFGDSPTVFVLQSGVVDCAPRPVSLLTRKVVGKLPGPLKKKVIAYLHDNRAKMVQRRPHYLTPPATYGALAREFIGDMLPKAEAIVVFNIAPTTPEIEAHSPGFGESIRRYNELLRRAVEDAKDPRVQLADIWTPIQDAGPETLMLPDGHHLTAGAHRVYFDAACAALSRVAEAE